MDNKNSRNIIYSYILGILGVCNLYAQSNAVFISSNNSNYNIEAIQNCNNKTEITNVNKIFYLQKNTVLHIFEQESKQILGLNQNYFSTKDPICKKINYQNLQTNLAKVFKTTCNFKTKPLQNQGNFVGSKSIIFVSNSHKKINEYEVKNIFFTPATILVLRKPIVSNNQKNKRYTLAIRCKNRPPPIALS